LQLVTAKLVTAKLVTAKLAITKLTIAQRLRYCVLVLLARA